jgi:hypothetical protein
MVAFDTMPPPNQSMGDFLRRTFEMRVAMAIAWNQEQIDRQLESLDRELLDIWTDDARALAQRKATLHALWEECGSGIPGGPAPGPAAAIHSSKVEEEPELKAAIEGEVDRARRIAGGRARRIIEAFVRRHAAEGSEDGFTRRELKRLNTGAKASDRFEPYHPLPTRSVREGPRAPDLPTGPAGRSP